MRAVGSLGEDAVAGGAIVAGDTAASWLVTLGGRPQSHVDLAEPTRLAFDYVRRVADVLDALAPAGERLAVLHVGGAGLTLPRYVAVTRPASRQVVLEPDAELTALVREHAPLPRRSGIKVRDVDGRTGLAAIRDASFAACVVDAFDAEGRTPPDLLTAEAFAEYARVLDDGCVIVNLRDSAPHRLARDVVAAAERTFDVVAVGGEPATWKGRRDGNLLLVASGDASAGQALAAASRSRAAPYRLLAGDSLRDALGGGTPRRDGGAPSA